MNCRELVEVITDYLEGSLPPDDRRRLEAHLAICDPCVVYLDQMRESIALTGRLALDDLAEATRQDLLAAFRGWRAA